MCIENILQTFSNCKLVIYSGCIFIGYLFGKGRETERLI